MIWKGFLATHKLSLIRIPSNRRIAVDYVEIVYDGVLDSFLEEHEGICKVVFMEDGAPMHRNKVAKDWRKNHDFEKIEWPAQSLDLNPIENVGKLLKDAMQKRCKPKNQEDIWLAMESEWKAIPATMPQKIQDVIAAGDGSTHWRFGSDLLWIFYKDYILESLIYKGIAMAPPHAITCIQKGRIVIVQVLFSKIFHNL